MLFHCSVCKRADPTACGCFKDVCDHYMMGHSVYRAAKDSLYKMYQKPWWVRSDNSDKITQFLSHPSTRIGVLQAPSADDARSAAYCLALDQIRAYSPSILHNSAALTARPVLYVAPARDAPPGVLDGLTKSLLAQLSPFVATPEYRGLGCEPSDPSFHNDSAADRLDVLAHLNQLVPPRSAGQKIGKRLCVVVDIDGARDEASRDAEKVVRALERLLVQSGIADVLFFTSRSWGLDGGLEEPGKVVKL
ncbi:hypothetical protein F4810DRAFT_709458 [Camillea tinctor]|nr:hypothetical protein F4810DRAFT_709458 [Camillea tinctor]